MTFHSMECENINMKIVTVAKKIAMTLLLLNVNESLLAQNWDDVRFSGDYYYGIGHGKTEIEATEAAMADLANMIATYVSSEFIGLTDETNLNGNIEHKSKVLNCVKTYSQSALTNVQKWPPIGSEPNITVRLYIKRSELSKIYEDRITKAKDMIQIADEALQEAKIDMALQYYYWAYSLIRSLQRPNEVLDGNGKCLVERLPVKIAEILNGIKVSFEKREGDCVDLLFTYNGSPLSSLEFTYLDGRAECTGTAKDGRGMIEMAPGYTNNVYHIDVEYEYKGQARGDAEMSSVLNVIPKRVFKSASINIQGKHVEKVNVNDMAEKTKNESPRSDEYSLAASKIAEIENAIRRKNYIAVTRHFTAEGLEMFNKLINYGSGRIVGIPNISFSKKGDGRVVARGMKMSFSFNKGTKKTFVEDVVFSFNKDNRIESVAFGLGDRATNDILNRNASSWTPEIRQQLLEFMENYKTAYCLQRLDYIKSIFADDAIIIIGNVAKPRTSGARYNERQISIEGQKVITYNRYSKDEYLKNLERCFNKNEFINIRFTNTAIQHLEKFENETLYGIQIGQEYNSTTYGDKGYLFLLLDLTNKKEPLIKVRTWQPNEVSMDKLYNAGDFYKD